MRAISLWRPWPWTILYADKRLENREHAVTYRGEFVIHAAKRFDNESVPMIERALRKHGYRPPVMLPSEHPSGALVGVATIVDCFNIDDIGDFEKSERYVNESQGDWAFGPYCWVLDDVRPFATPIPWVGQRGWFNVPEAMVREALASS